MNRPVKRVNRCIAEIKIERDATFYAEGWQSWSPVAAYALGQQVIRLNDPNADFRKNRPEWWQPNDAFHGEGLFAVEVSRGGPVHVFALKHGLNHVPVVQAYVDGKNIRVMAEEGIEHTIYDGSGGLNGALRRWAANYAEESHVDEIEMPPAVWNSWLAYFENVTDEKIMENVQEIKKRELPVDVIQLDDGYQRAWGDWLEPKPGAFSSIRDLVSRIKDRGMRTGIWIAPFHVKRDSNLFQQHPDWMLPGVVDMSHGGDRYILDVTNPAAAEYLYRVMSKFKEWGISYVKADFLYAGALEARRRNGMNGFEAYQHGLGIIRDAIGEDAYLLGCGAPIFPSVGLVDGMRVSTDAMHGEDIERLRGHVVKNLRDAPQFAAAMTSAARRWMQGAFWSNDTDSFMGTPDAFARVAWAGIIMNHGGLRSTSDTVREYDDWGTHISRALLSGGTNKPFKDCDLHLASFQQDFRPGGTGRELVFV